MLTVVSPSLLMQDWRSWISQHHHTLPTLRHLGQYGLDLSILSLFVIYFVCAIPVDILSIVVGMGSLQLQRLVRVSVFRESNNYDHYLLTVNLPACACQYSTVQCMQC